MTLIARSDKEVDGWCAFWCSTTQRFGLIIGCIHHFSCERYFQNNKFRRLL